MEQSQSITSLVQDIENGYAVLPEFQRDFVWEISRSIDLFDSLVKDIFIGAIIYGIPSFEMTTRSIDNRERKQKGKKRKGLPLKHFTKKEIEEKQKLNKSNFRLILDGQQRITSIYRCLVGIDEVFFVRNNFEELPEELQNKTVANQTLEDLLYSFDTEDQDDRISVKLSDAWKCMDEGIFEEEIKESFFKTSDFYLTNFDQEDFDESESFKYYLITLRKIQNLFKADKLLSYYLLDMTLDKFVLFFERSNSRGIQLNFIDILTAKLYEGFNLKENIKKFEADNSGYLLNEELIVRAIAYFISKDRNEETGKSIEIHRNFILTELSATHFNENWDKVTKWFRKSLEYLFKNNFAVHQNWIPYPNMIIPLIAFQKELNSGFDQMTDGQKEFIEYWYWCSVFSQRYTGSSNEKIIQDCNVLIAIARGEKIKDRTYFHKLSKLVISSSKDLFTYEKKQNAVYRGILNFINFSVGGYLDWNNTSKIDFKSEVDDHHIFPKDYILKNTKEEDEERDLVDSVVNKTLIPKITNIKIGNKAPSKYLNEIKVGNNPNISESIKSHIIDIDILNEYYDKNATFFWELRAEEIFKLINSKITDRSGKIKSDHFEEISFDKQSQIRVLGKYYSKIVEGMFNPKTFAIQYNGIIYETPSGAGIQAIKDLGGHENSTINGWTFWKYIDPSTGESNSISLLR
jgi:hypothetical protein